MRISVYDAIRYMFQYNLLISMTVPVQIGFLSGMFQPPKKEHPVTRFGSAAQEMHCTSFEAKNQPHCKTTYQTNIYQRNSASVFTSFLSTECSNSSLATVFTVPGCGCEPTSRHNVSLLILENLQNTWCHSSPPFLPTSPTPNLVKALLGRKGDIPKVLVLTPNGRMRHCSFAENFL